MRVACRITKKRIQTHHYNTQHLQLFHNKDGYANASECHVIRTMSVSYYMASLDTSYKDRDKVTCSLIYLPLHPPPGFAQTPNSYYSLCSLSLSSLGLGLKSLPQYGVSTFL
jgi:hypothetical protein